MQIHIIIAINTSYKQLCTSLNICNNAPYFSRSCSHDLNPIVDNSPCSDCTCIVSIIPFSGFKALPEHITKPSLYTQLLGRFLNIFSCATSLCTLSKKYEL